MKPDSKPDPDAGLPTAQDVRGIIPLSPVSTTAQCGAGDALKLACMRLQEFLDTFGDLGDCVTQADINDWLEAADSPAPVRAAQEDEFDPIREALESAKDALKCCYEVQSYPGDGSSAQDRALSKVKTVLERYASPQDNPQQKGEG